MFIEERSDDYTPIVVVGSLSVYATELLIFIHVVSMVVLAFAGPTSGLNVFLAYDPNLILGSFQFWRQVTYALQNIPSIGFAIGMLMLWFFGREVERFYGRRNFFRGYLILVLVPAIVGLLPIFKFSLVGPEMAHLGIFIVFAATYPGVMLMFNIQAKWFAWIYLALYSLIYVSMRDFNGFILLWLVALLAYSMTRLMGRGEWMPEWIQNKLPAMSKPDFTVVKPIPPSANSARENDPISSIDPILEKIARSGLASLSPKEHAALRAASGVLQRKNDR